LLESFAPELDNLCAALGLGWSFGQTGAAPGRWLCAALARRRAVRFEVTRDGYEVDVPGVVPKLLGTPGTVRAWAPHLGDDTNAVLGELGFSAQGIAALHDRKVVA
jgi:crotonobetainyl-CoA:carnitine CoA-transferase CaiB-like acyl-CoA transferase